MKRELTWSRDSNCFIDVRDLARALLLAVTKSSASGERIIASARPFRWEDFSECYTISDTFEVAANSQPHSCRGEHGIEQGPAAEDAVRCHLRSL